MRGLSAALPKRALVLTGHDPDARLLAATLMEAGVAVQLAPDPESAPVAVTAFRPQLVLARMTAFGLVNPADRLTVLRERLLRAGVPLILTAPSPAVPSAALADLLWRADDFVLEPLSLSELALRLEVWSLRSKSTAPGAAFVAGRLTLDLVGHKVAVDGESIPLTHKEFELMRFLAAHRGRVVTREMMLEQLWGK
ncbi:MAG: winged helix-turn-helix domain-containing protein, partial [Chloroflexi bacterium]|nr:winged helix-turn-helix domain-containing protein [Chloroflexota bacterium]